MSEDLARALMGPGERVRLYVRGRIFPLPKMTVLGHRPDRSVLLRMRNGELFQACYEDIRLVR